MEDDSLTISPPLYMVGMKIYCWKCQTKMTAIAILAPNIEDTDNQIFILCEIVRLPGEVLGYIQNRVPTFKYRYSKTVGNKYYANTCPNCGSISGDFYLHSEPGAPFFPTDEKEASQLYLTEIPIQGTINIQAGFHVGTGDMILNNAKRIA